MWLLAWFTVTPKMEAVCSSKISVNFYHTVQCYNLDNSMFTFHCFENLESSTSHLAIIPWIYMMVLSHFVYFLY
jgi:hypothetical protein